MKSFTLSQFNVLPDEDVHTVLTQCCGSRNWVVQMGKLRPLESRKQLLEEAVKVWRGLSQSDWKEAFSHHPKIGELKSLETKCASTKEWAEQEQKGSQGASSKVIQALALGNKNYENRFGYIFIVCATGKSAEEMLALLEQRLNHDPQLEMEVAAGEQEKIMKIRLEKLIHE